MTKRSGELDSGSCVRVSPMYVELKMTTTSLLLENRADHRTNHTMSAPDCCLLIKTPPFRAIHYSNQTSPQRGVTHSHPGKHIFASSLALSSEALLTDI